MDALLRALEANPSEIDTYLVYADQLQAQGDPRGEFIACHHAVRLDPHNRAAEQQAGRLLDAHRSAWLGPAAKRGGKELHIGWFMGFPERVHMKLGSIAASAHLLDQMLAHEGFRLVQRLILEVSESVFDAGAFWDLLEARGRPRPLRELRVGPPGRARLPETLLARFPRLRERPELSWTELRTRIGGQKRLKTGFEGATLPGLTLLDPALGLEVVSHELLLGLRAELDKGRQLGVLEAMRRLFTPGSLDHFALDLVRRWERSGGASAQRWVLAVAGALGGDHCAAYLASRLGSWSHARAVKATDVLVELGAPMGLNEIYQLSWHESSRSDHAAKALARMAKNRRVPVAAVLDRAVPTNPDTGTARRFLEIQLRWFEDLMVSGHRLTRSDFLHYVAAGPRRSLATGLVWGVFRGPECVASVRVNLEGALSDSSGQPAGIPADTKVGLLHPMEIEAATRRAWLVRFGRERQPIAQLLRPQLRLRDDERSSTTLFRFTERTASAPPSSWDGGRWTPWQSYDIERESTRYGYALRLSRGSEQLSCVAVYDGNEILRVFNRERRSFGEADPILVSELLSELERATTLPWTGLGLRLELRERAGGRCLACGRPFAQGQLCLALHRPVIRGGRHRAWAHWACAEQVPELQLGLEQADVAKHLRELRARFGEVSEEALLGPAPAPARPAPARPAAGRSSAKLDEATVLARCPDSKAIAASKKTAKLDSWSDHGHAGNLAWGEYAGSKRYQVVADQSRLVVHCSCPSRKRPCKHGIALLLLVAREELSEGAVPNWARVHVPGQ